MTAGNSNNIEEEMEDYEALPSSSTVLAHMGAGAMAGIMEHTVMYPLDCVKTRMQCLCPNPRANYRGVGDAVYRIVRFEGLRTTVRGIGAVVGGAGPAHAMYFACYEKLKKELSKSLPNAQLTQGAAGAVATVLHDAVMNPADAVKQRMQVFGSPYQNSLQCARQVYAAEGLSAFYRSYTTQLTMNVPFQAIHFMTYEAMQDWLNPNRKYDPVTHCASGAAAGAVAAAVTTPLDVCKTLLNTQEQCMLVPEQQRLTVRGFLHAVRTVYQIQGVSGYLRGLTPRILFQMPGTAISWSVYEFFKYVLLKREPHVTSHAVQLLGSVQAYKPSEGENGS